MMPTEASVVVVGAGLSGLVAATELKAAGASDVVVLEARDRVGGRLHAHTRPNGRELMVGGEFTGPAHVRLHALASSMEIEVESLPAVADVANMGKFVRIAGGTRIVEAFPLEREPEALEAYGAASARLDEMAGQVPAGAPWSAAHAAEWDRQTIGQWLDANVEPAAARAVLATDLAHFGDVDEVSLLFVLWCVARFGGWEKSHELNDRFVGGTAQIPRRLADDLGGAVFTGHPVRRIDHDEHHVVVHHDGGSIAAQAVVLAMEPGQAGKIEFSPSLPPARDRLQSRWLAGHGAKFFAVYDTPFWRADGLAGIATGPGPFGLALDVSPSEGDEGILLVLYFGSGEMAAALSEAGAAGDGCRADVVDALTSYFGPQAATPREFYAFDWSGDRWSQGCGTQLPTGVLSTVGSTLHPPLGRLVWAGADNGDMDWMEGAVSSGQRAAREVRALVGA